jgi:hypothetical protein
MRIPYQQALTRLQTLLEKKGGSAKLREFREKNIASTRAAIKKVQEASDNGQMLFFEYRNDKGKYPGWGFVHPSSYYPGMYRWSHFDEYGWSGHFDGFKTVEDALYDLFDYFYIHPDPGALQRTMEGQSWAKYLRNQAPAVMLRGKTAIKRKGLSRPLSLAIEKGILKRSWSVFDYGCGRGDDLKMLRAMGYKASGWDPVHLRKKKKTRADLVNLGFVINVIEDPKKRATALRGAWKLAKKVLVVSARLASENGAGHTPCGDGFRTSTGTFQKFYTQDELRDYVSRILKKDVYTLGPGVVMVFKGKKKVRNSPQKGALSRTISEAVLNRNRLRVKITNLFKRAYLDPSYGRNLTAYMKLIEQNLRDGELARKYGKKELSGFLYNEARNESKALSRFVDYLSRRVALGRRMGTFEEEMEDFQSLSPGGEEVRMDPWEMMELEAPARNPVKLDSVFDYEKYLDILYKKINNKINMMYRSGHLSNEDVWRYSGDLETISIKGMYAQGAMGEGKIRKAKRIFSSAIHIAEVMLRILDKTKEYVKKHGEMPDDDMLYEEWWQEEMHR